MVHWEQRSQSEDSDETPYIFGLSAPSSGGSSSSGIGLAAAAATSSLLSPAASAASGQQHLSPPPVVGRQSSATAFASVSYSEVELSGPPAQPLEFPAPLVHRGARITVNGCDHRTGKFHRVKNLLIRLPDRGEYRGGGEGGGEQWRGRTVIPVVYDRGYCIRRKICDTVYGSVRLCVVMKRRRMFLHESEEEDGSRRGAGRKHPAKKRGGSLESIGEDDDWAEDSLDVPPPGTEDEEDAVWESTDELVVVKVVSWSKVQHKRGRHLEDPLKEVAAMQLLGGYHPHVVGSMEVMQDSGHLYSITPHCDGGDLYSWTMNEFESNGIGRLDEAKARHWFKQILQGLFHLQQKGVCHRDISLENILVHQNRCAIIDFGMALRVPYSDPCNDGCVADVSAGTVRRLMRAQGQGGRWTYMAPEVVAREPQFDGFAVDLWAAGVSLYIMLVGLAPFQWAHESDRRFQKFSTGGLQETLRYWDIPLSDDACDLLQQMFWRDPRQRLTLAEIMTHPWIARGSRCGEQREGIERSSPKPKGQVSQGDGEQVTEKACGAKGSPDKGTPTTAPICNKRTSNKLHDMLRGKLIKETRQGSF